MDISTELTASVSGCSSPVIVELESREISESRVSFRPPRVEFDDPDPGV